MKRAVMGVIAVLSLALGVSVAQAHGGGHWGHWRGDEGQSSSPVVAVAGTVTSVDPSTGSFGANAFVPQGEGFHTGQGDQGSGDHHFGSGGGGGFHRDFLGGGTQPSQPSLTPVTITTNAATTFRVNGQRGSSLTDLAPGDRFVALFNGSPSDSLQTLVASPAVAVFAHTPPMQRQLYAFVGTVSGVGATAGTVSVTVSNSIPSGLVPSGSGPATFTVSPSTLILGGSSPNGLFGGSLSDVSVGDVVAGGLIGPAGQTLTQVESTPLQVLVDFPSATTSSSTTSSSVRRATRQRALTQALSLFGVKASTRTTGKGHKARHRKTHAHHRRRGTSRTRSHATRTRR